MVLGVPAYGALSLDSSWSWALAPVRRARGTVTSVGWTRIGTRQRPTFGGWLTVWRLLIPGFLPPLRCHPTTEQASPGGGVAGSGLFQLVHVQGNVAFLDLVHLWQLFLRDLPLAAFGGHSLPSDRRRVLPTDD